jgi:hypothetical protein
LDSQIQGDLIELLRQAALAIPNDSCRVAQWLIIALPLVSDADREQIRQFLNAKTAVSSAENCLVHVRAQLVKYLPEKERAAAVEEVVRGILRDDFDWSKVDETLGEVGELLNADQIVRLHNRASNDCCLSVVFAMALARSRQLDPREAVQLFKECQGCSDRHEDLIRLLPSLNQNERNQFLERKWSFLNDPPETWDLDHIYIFSIYVSFIEPERQRKLILAALRRLSQLVNGPEDALSKKMFDTHPALYFCTVFAAIAPAISDAQSVEAGFEAIPQAWPDDIRALVSAQLVEALPPEVKKQVVASFLQRLPGPTNNRFELMSQFVVAESFEVEELRAVIKHYMEVETDVRTRAEILGSVYSLMSEKDRAGLRQQIVRDLNAITSLDERGDAITAILNPQRRKPVCFRFFSR